MKKIVFLSCEDITDFIIDDALVVKELAYHPDIKIDTVAWTNSVDWSKYDAAIIRSTWDYTQHLDEFLVQLKKIQTTGCRLYNDLETVRWNANKKYLKDLEKWGAAIIPTECFSAKTSVAAIEGAVKKFNSPKVLIKPTVGANSSGVKIFSSDNLSLLKEEVSKGGEWLLQPYLPHIIEGERSYIFFNKQFSHAVLKVPKSGDFRVQEEHGAKIQAHKASVDEIGQAQKVLDLIKAPLLYGRVDMVPINGKLHVMELELIEPSLYFRYDLESPVRFANALTTI